MFDVDDKLRHYFALIGFPTNDLDLEIPAPVLAQVNQALSMSATGSAAIIEERLRAIIDMHRPDELLVTGMIHYATARIRSFEIAASVFGKAARIC